MSTSVVIAAYNAASTLRDTLDSLLAQTRADWEAVVVDDGSTDDTAAIAAGHAARDERIRLVRQANLGEGGARNTGIEHARHAWLLFLDSDDWIAPTFFERMTAVLEEDPTLDAVHCGYARVAPDGTEVVDPYLPPTGDMFDTWARRSAFPVHACVVRKSLVDAAGRFDLSLRRSADWDLWQRIARTGARFGAVRDVLAYYRMRPSASSLDGPLMLQDGMRVLRQGHAPDPRVRQPAPEHAAGSPPEQVATQAFYLLAWCAGLEIGAGRDARPMVAELGDLHFPQLFAGAVAQTLFDSVPLPTTRTPDQWEQLWPAMERHIDGFLDALEAQSMATGVARHARTRLMALILRHSPRARPVIEYYEQAHATLTEDRDNWQRLAAERATAILERDQALDARHRIVADRDEMLRALERTLEVGEARARELEQTLEARDARLRALEQTLEARDARLRELEQTLEARDARLRELEQTIEARDARLRALEQTLEARDSRVQELERSAEQLFGNLVLNRLRLRRPIAALANMARRVLHRAVMIRLRWDRLASRGQPRVMTTIISSFPVYSHSFVYQELQQLMQSGYRLRLVYSMMTSPGQLDARFRRLWPIRRPLVLNYTRHAQDLAHYRRRMPERVEALLALLSEASGLSREALLAHGNVLQGFTFARMVEAYRPHYLHSYFFYDRSLMALIAGYLLGIPRGVTCYADHVLADYELKVVPLHLALCDVVLATSARIKRELLALAPGTDDRRIIVKPNGIDASRFPVVARFEPAAGNPFRLVSVCRIEPKKGLVDLVDAVALLRQRGVNVEAHIVGAVDEWSEASREYKGLLDQRITELGLWGTIHLEGRHGHDGVLRFHGISHLFVAPFVETETGDKDGIPTALLEGMSTGLAAVATDAGSIVEVIENGYDGLIVPQRNPAALADAVEALLRDPVRRARLAAEAAATVRKRFDVATCETAFHDRLRDLLAR